MKRIAVALIAAALLLAGCGGDDHKGEHCIAHDTVLVPIVHTTKYSTFTTYVYVRQCSQWAPNNPATVTP